MSPGLGLVALAIAVATATSVLIIREIHFRALNVRVSNAVMGVPGQTVPFRDMTGWFSSLGMRYRRFYADENLDQLRTILQSSGFNHHRTLPIWIGVKTVSMFAVPIVATLVAQLSGMSPMDVLIYTLFGVVIGIMGPRLLLWVLKRRFDAAVRLGTLDTIDLLVVCSDNGADAAAFERMPQPDGSRTWTLARKQDAENPQEFWDYCDRRRRQDEDLWIVELDIADAQRFADELILMG